MEAEPVTLCLRISRWKVTPCVICVFTIACFAGTLFLLWPGPAAAATERLVIDTDAGIDDASAILAILGDTRYGHLVEGITCVRGNTEADNVAINVLKILKIADRLEVPVYPGAKQGLISSPSIGQFYGEDGFGDANYPDPPSKSLLQKIHAAVYLSSIVSEYPGEITILMLGPMTNVALAMRLNPKFMSLVKQIIAVGGEIIQANGVYRPNVQYNFFMDPNAATIVFHSSLQHQRKITLVSMESVTENLIDIEWRTSILAKINTTKIDFLNRIEKPILTTDKRFWMAYDLYAATVLLRPEAVTDSKELYVDVENEGRLTRGVIVVDYKNVLNQSSNADIVFSINSTIVMDIAIKNFK